jgi:hypothetical protein
VLASVRLRIADGLGARVVDQLVALAGNTTLVVRCTSRKTNGPQEIAFIVFATDAVRVELRLTSVHADLLTGYRSAEPALSVASDGVTSRFGRGHRESAVALHEEGRIDGLRKVHDRIVHAANRSRLLRDAL